MKKFFYTVILITIAAGIFSSCKKDDKIKSSYAFYTPILDWNYTETDVRNEMNGSNWSDWDEKANSNELEYTNKDTKADIKYVFKDGKLNETTIYYYSSNKKFDQMKNDWQEYLNLTWEEYPYGGYTFYKAKYAENHCEIYAYSDSNNAIDIMYINFKYSNFVW